MKAKVVDLGYEVRVGFSRQMRKALSGMEEEVYGKMWFFMRFEDKCDNYLTSNQITIMTVDRIHTTKEAKATTIYKKPE